MGQLIAMVAADLARSLCEGPLWVRPCRTVCPKSRPHCRVAARKQTVRLRPDRAQSSRSEYCARNAGRQIADPDKHVKEERRKSFEFYRHQLADVTITTFDELIAELRAPLAFLKPAQSPEKGSPLAVPAQGAVPQSCSLRTAPVDLKTRMRGMWA